jgi:phosphoribosylformylglycinamidine cyclo-ligase
MVSGGEEAKWRVDRQAWIWASGTDVPGGPSVGRSAASRPAGKRGFPLFGGAGSFSNWMDFGPLKVAMTCDGIGTKAEVAERTGIYHTLGYDLVAMVADDLVANGIEPINLVNVLDVDKPDEEIIDSLMRGLHDGCMECGIAVVGGEIAELGAAPAGGGRGCISTGAPRPSACRATGARRSTAAQIEAGDTVIALKSAGFRSNGFSLVRAVLEKAHGPLWHDVPSVDGRSWGEVALTPSFLCTPSVLALIDAGIPLRGAGHITGGGIPGKFGRVLKKSGFGARLDNLFAPHDFMQALIEMGDIPLETAIRQWNMGNAMLLVVPPSAAEATLSVLSARGVAAQIAGEIAPGPIVIQGVPFTP